MEARGSKPRRIKALLSSFLKKENYVRSEPKSEPSTNEDTSTPSKSGNSPIAKSSPAVTVQPLNKESFIQRVDTFTTSTWFAKPHSLSPPHCARYGWQNIDVDTLSCVSCKELFVVSLPPSWQKEQYSSACDRVREQLSSSHGKICPWAGSPSPESYITIAMNNAKQEVARYKERVARLVNIFENLPCVEFSVLKDQSLENNAILGRLVEYSRSLVPEESIYINSDTWNIVVMMALFGWYRSEEHISLPVVRCECCRKQAGLWNYTPSGDGDESSQDEDTDEPPLKKIKDVKLSSFSPASEHRPWCPWVYCEPHKESSKDKSPDSRPAWLQLLDILLSKADPVQFGSTSPLTDKTMTQPGNAWKAVRRLVSFWQSSSTPPKNIGSSPPSVK